MDLDNVINLLKKKGFSDTFNILFNSENYSVEIHGFYRELNKISYYNSFLRIKENLLRKNLIRINKSKKKKYINLTDLGIEVYNRLIELNEIIIEG